MKALGIVAIILVLLLAAFFIVRHFKAASSRSKRLSGQQLRFGLSGELPLKAAMSEDAPMDMKGATGLRMRLRVRIAKALTTDAQRLSVMMLGREVTISSQNKAKSLKDEKWIILSARGFANEEEAWRFGRWLIPAVQLAALSSRLGVDVGENKPSTWMSEEFARAMGLIKDQERIAPNVHGLAVLPDDELTRFPLSNATATVTADPNHLISALQELGEQDLDASGTVANGVRLLNFALMTSEPLAQMVLAVSSIEELGQNQKWSDAQKALIKTLAEAAESSAEGTEGEREEVATAIKKGLFRLSLREGVKRVLASASVEHLIKEWDRLYGIRSGVFHGTAQLSESELHKAGQETITLCTKILFAIISKEGKRVPTIADTHYGNTNL
jgi:hypothetical protein